MINFHNVFFIGSLCLSVEMLSASLAKDETNQSKLAHLKQAISTLPAMQEIQQHIANFGMSALVHLSKMYNDQETPRQPISQDYEQDFRDFTSQRITFEQLERSFNSGSLEESVQDPHLINSALAQLNDVLTDLFQDPEYTTPLVQSKLSKVIEISKTTTSSTGINYEITKALACMYRQRQADILKNEITKHAHITEPSLKKNYSKALKIATTKKDIAIAKANSQYQEEKRKEDDLYKENIAKIRKETGNIANVVEYLDEKSEQESLSSSSSSAIHLETKTNFETDQKFLELLQSFAKK